jgi:hypothetical protein
MSSRKCIKLREVSQNIQKDAALVVQQLQALTTYPEKASCRLAARGVPLLFPRVGVPPPFVLMACRIVSPVPAPGNTMCLKTSVRSIFAALGALAPVQVILSRPIITYDLRLYLDSLKTRVRIMSLLRCQSAPPRSDPTVAASSRRCSAASRRQDCGSLGRDACALLATILRQSRRLYGCCP